jgi:cysteine synthase A
MHALSERLGRRVGASTGTNLVAALACAQQTREAGKTGSIVTLLCDGGERYAATYYDRGWLGAQGLHCDGQRDAIRAWMDGGDAPAALVLQWQLAGALAGVRV